MGRMSELMIEQQQEKNDKELAAQLGITLDELHQSDYSFTDDTGNDGLVYATYVQFNPDSTPKHILKKMKLDSMHRFETGNNSGE
jgi:hypothetical protein